MFNSGTVMNFVTLVIHLNLIKQDAKFEINTEIVMKHVSRKRRLKL